MKVVVFGATNSAESINKQLVRYAGSLVEDAEVKVLDLNDYELPIFSLEREKSMGQPDSAYKFNKEINEADLLIISFAEFNGSYTSAYKNIFDWVSRIDNKVFQNKKAIFLATSPGPGGASNVLSTAVTSAPFFDSFDVETGKLINKVLNENLLEIIRKV
jgi:NAD(P)H-dependent FMN reductase